MYFFPAGGGPLLDLLYVFAILGAIIYGIVLVMRGVKHKAGKALREAERKAVRFSDEMEYVHITKYGVWHDAWFTPYRKLTVSEFYEAVKLHEKQIREAVDPSYRYKGPMRLEPDEYDG
ncbi:hypothetical protein PC1C4_28730 [Paraprevotella clara]|jgi:hypothetical protein|uniref:hypothetical protein n=1 Tax=Paraprevotella clara TaxID=454154 RepID=UPI00248F8EDA|nr:hypothetical protein [Paraprevotella clara]BDI76151.1 hypothetical protein PC1C4_28730 [Paraprevotella clara]